MLEFVAAGAGEAREYDVAKDPRTGDAGVNPPRRSPSTLPTARPRTSIQAPSSRGATTRWPTRCGTGKPSGCSTSSSRYRSPTCPRWVCPSPSANEGTALRVIETSRRVPRLATHERNWRKGIGGLNRSRGKGAATRAWWVAEIEDLFLC